MKLRSKLLILPALGGVLMLALCAAVSLMMQRANAQLDELVDVRVANYAAAFKVQGQLAAMHADAYRSMVGIDKLKADALSAQRTAFKGRAESVTDQVRLLAGTATAGESGGLEALAEGLPRYARAVDTAIDLGSVDTNTGMASMQTADGLYRALAAHAEGVLVMERQLAEASVAAGKARDRRNLALLWAATLLAVAASLAVAWRVNSRMMAPLEAAREVADSIAAGKLGVRLPKADDDEIGQLVQALGRMADHLKTTVGSIRGSADRIATASNEIAVGNSDLSQRTEQQASSLQQTSSSMEELTATVATNADNARQANQLALGASEVARRGGEVVEQVVSTMGEISDSSRKIADIIGVIDGIAFQTNILALNAAVEAARAGEQGRGFSVVAAEVRSLAQRSAEAARQIKGLIGDSVERVDSGSRLVQEAGTTMQEIVTSVRRVTDIIGEISSATSEQSSGIGQVNTAVLQLDRMTQQNAALVEQSAAAAESLKEQARRLAEAIGTFQLDDAPSGQETWTPSRASPAHGHDAFAPPAATHGAPAARAPVFSARTAASRPTPVRPAAKAAPASRALTLPAARVAPTPSPAPAPSSRPERPAPVVAAPAPKAATPVARSAVPASRPASPAPRAAAKSPDDDWEEF